VQVKDGQGKVGNIGVIIKEKQTKFTSVQYLEKVDKIE
jgi:hypothetical protein